MIFVVGLAFPADAARKSRDEVRSKVKKTEARKDFGELPKGPLQLVVNIGAQHVSLYANGHKVAQGPVATGMPGHPTPMGVFSVIEKDRYHHSNIYSGAPMPFMQRITWSGVALHEGPLPGYPASHGCIRMSHDFASKLWLVTKLGVRVIVARSEVTPTDFSHPNLFVPKPKPAEPPVAEADPDKHAGLIQAIQVAQETTTLRDVSPELPAAPAQKSAADETSDELPAPPASVETITPAGSPEPLRGTVAETPAEVETTAATHQPSAEPPKPAQAPAAAEPAKPVQATPAAAEGGLPVVADPPKPEEVIELPKRLPPPRPKAADQPPKRAGHVAVFVSRKEKKIFVRQGFVPLFDMPVEIDNPEQPLGTHVYTAMEVINEGTAIRWNVMSLPPNAPKDEPKHGKTTKNAKNAKHPEPAPKVEAAPLPTAGEALSRIHIPQEALDRIGEILNVGSSLTVSDYGLGRETGKYTDFIVVTNNYK